MYRGTNHGITIHISFSNARARYMYCLCRVSKGAKVRNRYNQVPHLTQDTNGHILRRYYLCGGHYSKFCLQKVHG